MTIQRRTVCDDVCTVAFVQSYVTVLKFSIQPTLLSIVLLSLFLSTVCFVDRMVLVLASEAVGTSLDQMLLRTSVQRMVWVSEGCMGPISLEGLPLKNVLP